MLEYLEDAALILWPVVAFYVFYRIGKSQRKG